MATFLCAITVLCALFGNSSQIWASDMTPQFRNGFSISLPADWQVMNAQPLLQEGGSILLLAEDPAGTLKLSVVAAANGTLLQDEFGEMDTAGVTALCTQFRNAMANLGMQQECRRVETEVSFALRMVFAIPGSENFPPMENITLLFPDKPSNMVISALFPESGKKHYLPLMDTILNGVALPPALP